MKIIGINEIPMAMCPDGRIDDAGHQNATVSFDDIDSSMRRMVSTALERLISLAGTEITQRVYVTEQRELWRATAADSIRTRGAITDFGRTLEGRRRDF